MTIYLVRHGQAAAGVDNLDPGLSPLGHEQAQATAAALATVNAAVLVVSPLRRTRETAIPIAKALGLEAEIRHEVAEVFDPEMPVEERRNMIGPFMQSTWGEQPEYLRAWRDRAAGTILELGSAASEVGKDLVVVSHYIAIGVAIGAATGDDRVVPTPMANCSITTLRVGSGGLELVEAASTAHLTPEQVTGIHTAIAGGG